MTIKKNILSGALAAASVMGLAACGGDEKGSQDVGSAPTPSQALNGRVVDGYLAGAVVYVDRNENGKLDAFEPSAVTDKDGFFSYNPLTQTNYCAENATQEMKIHCLKYPVGNGESVVIRSEGGYDTITGLPFKGTLSRRSSDFASGELRLVTPQSSLVAASSEPSESLLDTLKVIGVLESSGSLDDDPISWMGASLTRTQFVTSLVRQLSGAVNDTAKLSGNPDWDLNWDLDVYEWASERFTDIVERVTSPPTLGDAIDPDEMLHFVRFMVFSKNNPGQSMPEDYRLPDEAALASRLERLQQLAVLTDDMAGALQNWEFTSEPSKAATRVQALLTELIARNPSDQRINDLFDWTRNQIAQGGGNGFGADMTALGGENVDLGALLEPTFNFDPASNTLSASAVIPPEAANAFASLVNTTFGIRVDKGDEQGAALIYISGKDGASSGNLDVCVRYRDDSGDFDTGSASDPNGAMLINGSWSLLNNYTLVLNLNVVGGVRPLVLKSVGVAGSGLKYRFDFGGDLSEWQGTLPAGIPAGGVPADDAACRSALINEFGQIG